MGVITNPFLGGVEIRKAGNIGHGPGGCIETGERLRYRGLRELLARLDAAEADVGQALVEQRDLLIVVLMAFAMPLAVLWLRPGLVLVAVALAVAVVYLVAAQLTFNGNTILSVVYPLVGLTLGTVEATAADLWAERRQRRQLEVYKVAYERLPSAASAAFFISYRRDQSSWPARIRRCCSNAGSDR